MVIYKYQIEIQRESYLWLPRQSRVLSLQPQNNLPTFWILVEPTKELIPRRILLFTTGEPVADLAVTDMDYVGTCQTTDRKGGPYISHIFIDREPR